MGLFKQMKDMKNVLHEAPGMVAQAQALGAQAQQLQQAQAAAGPFGGLGAAPTAAELEPINGITLERYAQLAKSIGTKQLQGPALESFLAAQGHTEADWQAAYDGWNARMKANMALSTQFGSLYQAAVAV